MGGERFELSPRFLSVSSLVPRTQVSSGLSKTEGG